MSKLLNEIRRDVGFIKSHTIQPQWYKILKVFILLGGMLGSCFVYGILKTVIFFGTFFSLSFLVHMIYRVKTDIWKRSWLDFVVVEDNNEIRAQSIGRFYYFAVILNAILALVISLVVF